MEKVLFYGGEELDVSAAFSIIQELNMNPVLVRTADLGQTLGYLAGREGFKKTESEPQESFQESFMIFDQVADERIMELSKAFASKGMPYHGIKAVITEHNQHWKMVDLFQEICREHAYFDELGKLQRLLQQGNQYQQKDYTENSWMRFQGTVLEAYMIYQSRPERIDELIQASDRLRAAMEQLESL